MTGPSEGLDGIDDPARKKGSRLERESAEARERRGNLKEIPQKAFFTGGCLLLTRGPPRKMDQNAAPNTDHFFADQLRRLAMKVEGISFAGGKAGVLLSGTDSGIVLRVVTSRARV